MLAIAGGKGGCGKTTTAVGLARALAQRGESPLVADTDVEMPDLHLVAGVPERPGLGALASGDGVASVAQRPPGHASVGVLPAGDVSVASAGTAIERLREWRGPVLLDSPAGAARDAAVSLRQADSTLLVTTPRPQTLRDTAKTAAMARALDAPPVGVVVVDLPPSTVQSSPLLPPRNAEQLFGCSVIGEIPGVSEPPLQVEIVRTAYQDVAKKVQERNI